MAVGSECDRSRGRFAGQGRGHGREMVGAGAEVGGGSGREEGAIIQGRGGLGRGKRRGRSGRRGELIAGGRRGMDGSIELSAEAERAVSQG